MDNQNFQKQLILGTSPVDDHESNKAVETFLAKESGAQEGKRGSTWDIGIWLELPASTNEHLVGTRTGKVRPEPLDGLIARSEAGWTPTPGCKEVTKGVLE